MSKREFIDENQMGCSSTGIFRRPNCANQISMLRSVMVELQQSKEYAEQKQKILDAAAEVEVVAYIGESLAKTTGNVGIIHEIDQTQSYVQEMAKKACASLAISCPGGKSFSTLCQAELVFVQADGNIEPIA